MKVEGFVLNRTYIGDSDSVHPNDIIEQSTQAERKEAFAKLVPLAEVELNKIEFDRGLFEKLEKISKESQGDGAVALPYLDETVEDLAALSVLSERILWTEKD